MNEPSECPKCGRVPVVWHDEGRGWHVSCRSASDGFGRQCKQPGSGVYREQGEAVTEWNRLVQGKGETT